MALQFTQGHYFYESKAYVNLFNRDILVCIDKDCENISFDYAETCVAFLNDMTNKMLDELCKYSVRYCNEFCEEVGEQAPLMETDNDILKYICPTTLMIEEQKDNDVVIHLSCNCDWEQEHGLEWLIKGEKILYVGSDIGIAAYTDEKHFQKLWNYAYSPDNC